LHNSDLSKFRQKINYKDKGYTDCGCNEKFEPGIVLDPFFGSGTVGYMADKLSRNWIGIELNPEYVDMSKERRIEYIKIKKELVNKEYF